MYTYLFFDDQKLFKRSGLRRKYEPAEILADAAYSDGVSITYVRTGFVFKTDDGKYRLLYMGRAKDNKDYCFIAKSDDGINFVPEDVSDKIENQTYPHELFPIENGEIAEIIEDTKCEPAERYKMLICLIDGEKIEVHGYTYVSPDLINWTQIEGHEWNAGGAEPPTGVFYNKKKNCYTILVRPDWGVRKVGYVDTCDWRSFTPYEDCMQCDSLDTPLCEIYGVPAMEYKGYYIGFPLVYRGFSEGNNAKFADGTMEAELAYSYDGHHWQRSIREPYFSGISKESIDAFGHSQPMVWPSCFRVCDNGDVMAYCASTQKEHGGFDTRPPFHGVICAYRIKEDRFIGLETEDGEGVVATRENIMNSGEVHINLLAQNATVAIYETKGDDLLGYAKPIAGYSHEDCVPFSGDATHWVPEFSSGKTVSELAGKVLVFEVKLTDGKIFSISGDFTPVMNIQATRYRSLGQKPERIL